MIKRVTRVLLSIAMLLTVMPMAVSAEDYPTLFYKEEMTVTVEEGGVYWYQFTPATTQFYSFYSYDNDVVDPFAVLYDATKTEINRNDDYEGRNFCVGAELAAGETYYIETYDLGQDNAGSFKLMVGEIVPTTFYVNETAISRFVGAEVTLTTTVYPVEAVKTITWTSSDESVATVNENGKVTCLAGGEATITAETINGLTDTCEVHVESFDGTISLGETTFVITEDEATKETMLAFTPTETGFYRLYSYDIVSDSEDMSVDPRVRVYDEECDELEYSDDDGEDVNFHAEAPMEAGKIYYCEFTLYKPEATGSYRVMIEKMLTATSVSIDSGDIVMEQGNSHEVEVTYTPEGCWIEEFQVESSDETVVSVSGNEIYAVGAGEATVTVTTDLGLTDDIKVIVNGATPIVLDKTYTLSGTQADDGGNNRYSFVPAVSGRYTISSTETVGEGATVNVALSTLGEDLRRNDNESDTFSLTYELEADVEYYYDVEIVCDAAESAVSFTLTKANDNDIPEATLFSDLPVNIDNPGNGAYYAFKPTVSGEYTIFSQMDTDSGLDPKLIVYDGDWEYLTYQDDIDGGDRNFCLEYEFTAGETYYLKAILYNNDTTGEYTMRIEPLFDMVTPGDVNLDGVVNMRDAMMLYNAVSTGATLTDDQHAAADMDDNDMINMRDVMKLYSNVSVGA